MAASAPNDPTDDLHEQELPDFPDDGGVSDHGAPPARRGGGWAPPKREAKLRLTRRPKAFRGNIRSRSRK